MYNYKMTGCSYDGDIFKFRFNHDKLISKEKFKHICEMCIIKAARYVMKTQPEFYPYAHNSSMDEIQFVKYMIRFGFITYQEHIDVDFQHDCFHEEDYGKELKQFETEMDKIEHDEFDKIFKDEKPKSSGTS